MPVAWDGMSLIPLSVQCSYVNIKDVCICPGQGRAYYLHYHRTSTGPAETTLLLYAWEVKLQDPQRRSTASFDAQSLQTASDKTAADFVSAWARRKPHTIHFEDLSHLIRFQQQPGSNPYSSLQHSRDMYSTGGPRSRRRGTATATVSGLTGVVVRPHSPRSAQLSRIAFPRGRCGRLAAAGGTMAAMLTMVARGCGGVWRRLRQSCAGRPGSGPFPRGERAVASNARGGTVSAGKSGYGAGMLRERGR